MPLTKSDRSHRLARHLTFEQVESRRLMASDLGITQPVIEISGESQLMIELINRARANPSAEAARLGIDLNQNLSLGAISVEAKQPLAPNQHLIDAALAHSEDMLANDYFAHLGLDGSTPSTRAEAAGYSTGVAENLAYYPVLGRDAATLMSLTHDLLFQSAGHRQNLMNDFMRDVGVGVATGDRAYESGNNFLSAFTTEKFGRENNNAKAITGVAYTDSIVGDDRYTIGEGIANILIEAVASTGERYATRTGTSGGYSLRVPSGQYSVRAFDSATNTVASLGRVVVGESNVKLDLVPEQFSPLNGTDTASPGTEVPENAASLDVNMDGVVSPIDVLTIINHLNERSAHYDQRIDVNRDSLISPVDVLILVNHLNAGVNVTPASAAYRNHANTPQDSRLAQLIAQATQDMQGRFTADWEMVVESAKRVTWSDSSLDLGADPNHLGATPGYQIVMRYATLLLEYRASEMGPLQLAGWNQIADYLADEDGYCCPWDIDAPCLEAIDNALHAITVDYIHSTT